MTTATVQVLRQKHATLKDKEGELTRELRTLATVQENAKRISRLRADIKKVNEELRENNAKTVAAKAERKSQRLTDLVASSAYQEALLAALGSAADFLAPWARVIALEAEARQVNCPLPYLPPFITSFVVELRAWLRPLVALGAVDPKKLPEPLRGLIEEAR